MLGTTHFFCCRVTRRFSLSSVWACIECCDTSTPSERGKARRDFRLGSKSEELTASTTSPLHPWELTVQQMLRLDGSGPQTDSCAAARRTRDHDGNVKFVERQLFADPNAAAQDRRDRERRRSRAGFIERVNEPFLAVVASSSAPVSSAPSLSAGCGGTRAARI